ncbi:MAG: nitroreductase family protein [Verrucomicrobia bacterium]|nr:nitroreductase family protein [Verrucomicrobiota bacterium]
MEFFDVMRKRFSVRAYQEKPVDESALRSILEAVNGAPSAFNAQACEVVVVRDAARKEALAKACFNQMFAATAPVMLVFFANPDRNREKIGETGAAVYSHEDATIACDYAHLAAAALGLGSCWIAAYGQKAVSEALGAPASWCPVALLSIGHPAEAAKPRERRPLTDMVHEEQTRK